MAGIWPLYPDEFSSIVLPCSSCFWIVVVLTASWCLVYAFHKGFLYTDMSLIKYIRLSNTSSLYCCFGSNRSVHIPCLFLMLSKLNPQQVWEHPLREWFSCMYGRTLCCFIYFGVTAEVFRGQILWRLWGKSNPNEKRSLAASKRSQNKRKHKLQLLGSQVFRLV